MSTTRPSIGDPNAQGLWLNDVAHRARLMADAKRQLAFFRPSLRGDGGFNTLTHDGSPLPYIGQELHTTTRMVHSYALGHTLGVHGCDDIIDAGMKFLWTAHRDTQHGGYGWSAKPGAIEDGLKLAYGHGFVLLAASSAKVVGHPDADRLIADISEVLDTRYWEKNFELFADEYNRDWSPFSTYRGMNANMHSVEAHLGAFEATGEQHFLDRAGRILDFFVNRMAPNHEWTIPEHYTNDWQIDSTYEGDPMFRPMGTTPGHSFELGRLTLQHWDLSGRTDDAAPIHARKLIETARDSAWDAQGGFVYTLDSNHSVLRRDRYWWPVAEAIGSFSALLKIDDTSADEDWYRRSWQVADEFFIDHEHGGWFPEIDQNNRPDAKQFAGKPDIYHALQADLIPLASGLSRLFDDVGKLNE